jgi:hypothetical protein
MDSEIRHFGPVELRHQSKLALQMTGDGDVSMIRALHTDGTASIGNINRFLLHEHENLKVGLNEMGEL